MAYAEPTPYVIPEGGLATAQHIAVIAPYVAPLTLKEEPATLEDLSQAYNISRERVRQLENRAYEKVERAIRSAAAAQAAA